MPLRRAARALAATLARCGQQVEVDVADLLAPLPLARPDEWSGYLDWPHGWLGVALPDAAARELFDTLSHAHGLRGMPAAQAARVLQSFGIAALPAWAAASSVACAVSAADAIGRAGQTRHALTGALLRSVGEDRRILAGCRVIDMGRLVAAPLAARLLEELGAEVIRVRPAGIEEACPGVVLLDLGSAAGRATLAELAAGADLLVENCGLAAGERLTQLLARHPPWRRISIRGFAPDSPRRHWRAYGFLFEAAQRCGYAPRTGARGPVAASRVPVLDRATGLLAAAQAVDGLLGTGAAGGAAHRTLSLQAVARAVGTGGSGVA